MNTTDHLREAYQRTFDTKPTEDMRADPDVPNDTPHGKVADYLLNLKAVRNEVSPPTEPNIGDDLAYAMLNPDAPLEERRYYANRAINNAKNTFFEKSPSIGGIDITQASQRADGLSTKFVSGIVEAAASYPEPADIKPLKDDFLELLNPDKKTPEDTVVAAIALANVLQPYIVDRMLACNVYDPEQLKEQINQLHTDVGLMLKFYTSISHAVEFSTTGKTTISDKEVADKLFAIGPIFAQLGQSFTTAAQKSGGDTESKAFIGNVGRAMQEGVAKPDDEQIGKIATDLPQGLELKEVFSSAKIAYVAKTQSPEGVYATKIKRPHIKQAISDNARMFTVMGEALTSYIETHAADTPLGQKLAITKQALPFYLKVMENNMRKELEFGLEAQRQRRAAEVFANNPGILVPSIIDSYPSDDIITMELVPGERIEHMPAHRDYLKNAMVLYLKGRRRGALMHGDMHGGNVKAATESMPGTIVAYDWGKSFEIPKHFESNLIRFLASAMRKNPRAMAKSYSRIQSTDHYQASLGEIEAVAAETITASERAAANRIDGRRRKGLSRRLHETQDMVKSFIVAMGVKHQSTLDTRYADYMSSVVSLATIMATELAKPAYAKRSYKTISLLSSAAKAIKQVYFSKSKNSSR